MIIPATFFQASGQRSDPWFEHTLIPLMNLPGEVSRKILDITGMAGLDNVTESRFHRKLETLRKDMRVLAQDFAARKYSEASYRDAYFLYNFPTNFMKTAYIIKRIAGYYPRLLESRKRLRILDMGCGDGAGICGCYYALSDLHGLEELNFVGIDDSVKMLQRARILARWLKVKDPRLRVRFSKKRITGALHLGMKQKYDIVMAINSLAEIVDGEEIPGRFIKAVTRSLVNQGLFLIIEPALKSHSRRLMKLRDRLASYKNIEVILPCLHESACALIEIGERSEWCHQSVSWTPPAYLKVLNRGMNREIDVLKFSYLLIARGTARIRKPRGYPVISHLLKEKGRKRCFICTGQGRVELVRLDRARSATNTGFDRIHKGVIVQVSDIVRKKVDYWQVTEGSTIEILK